ncbi:MAG TPA: type IV toxin-antitoxin system AbiEi family antitoxin domain-containing protein [Solirubrobacteraceae bacterium]|nr:type IV toxin-antitoxin system AbiEi family antitoxin domain-containing protein [Solirubrobacteraceae bacterium]
MSRWPYREIAALADRRGTMITRAQLLALGASRSSIDRAVALGRLYRVHHGVYSIAPPGIRPVPAAEHAALLACGPAAIISHWSAAWLHALLERRPSIVEVTVIGDRGRRRAGIEVHRVTALERADRTRVGRLPATSVARTVIDLSPRLADAELERLLDRALRKASRAAVHSALERAAGRPGTARLRALLDPARPSADAWSAAERRLLELIRDSGLPLPECNVPLGDHGWVPDLLWRAQRVIVEYDSWAFHSGPAAFHNDRARHNELTALGYQVIHVTWRDLSEHPERVLVWIAAALARADAV